MVCDVFTGHFTELLGTPCWGVRRGFGRSLSIEFGDVEARLQIPNAPLDEEDGSLEEAEFGEWHLWLYETDWELGCMGRVVARSWFDDQQDLDAQLKVLDGHSLSAVEPEADGHTVFFFSNDYFIRTLPTEAGRHRWALKQPSGQVVTVHGQKFTVVDACQRPQGPWEPVFPVLH